MVGKYSPTSLTSDVDFKCTHITFYCPISRVEVVLVVSKFSRERERVEGSFYSVKREKRRGREVQKSTPKVWVGEDPHLKWLNVEINITRSECM